MENFKIEFQPKLTSKERSIFRYLLDTQNGRGSNKIKVSVEETASRMKIEREDIDVYLKKLMKKQFFLYEGGEGLYSNVFEYIKVQDENIYFSFVKKIFRELDGNKNFLGIDLTPFFYFSERTTGKFYIDILNRMRRGEKTFRYSLEELKGILEVGESYGRFYDFERFILKKLMRDIGENTSIQVGYERIQMSEKKGSKVVGVMIGVEGESPQSKKSFTQEALSLIGSRIADKGEIEGVAEVIRFTLKHSLDETLEKDMLNALVKLSSNDELLHLEEFKYTNIFTIQSMIIRKLKSMYPEYILYDTFFSHGLLKELYKFKSRKSFNFRVKNLEIIMVLSEDMKVKIEFWERNDKGGTSPG